MEYQQFNNIITRYGLSPISCQQFDNFVKYYRYLIEENSKYNLTAIVDEEEVFIKHFLDSILSSNLIKDNSKVIDIGCGAGFPSIPLKIINPTIHLTLCDAVNKKVEFVNKLSTKVLELSNVTPIHARCEDLAKNPKYREKYDFAVSRAVAPLNILLEYLIPFIKVGGKCIIYKGKNADEEIENAITAIKLLNCELADRIHYHIDEIDSDREILIFNKVKPTDNNYPRQNNKIRKNPL